MFGFIRPSLVINQADYAVKNGQFLPSRSRRVLFLSKNRVLITPAVLPILFEVYERHSTLPIL